MTHRALLMLMAGLVLTACGQTEAGSETAISSVTPTTTDDPDSRAAAPVDDPSTQLMNQLLVGTPSAAAAALEEVLAGGDARFVPVLLELMRARQVGIYPALEFQAIVDGLEQLSGQNLAGNWADWVEWYGGTDLVPPPGFTGWKGRLLSFIDPRFADFLYEDAPSDIRVEEIVWGGVTVDGIPALDQAEMIAASEAKYLIPEEPVFGISINGDNRAYPLRILDWHEMANDVVGGVPLSLAYCTLCGAGIAFDGRAPDGETYNFGSSGFLYRSNKLMYDRQTRTLWNQLTGQPVLGELVGSGVELELLPVVLTSWADWQAQHPDTQVLALETGFERFYEPGAAYGHYFSSEATMFPVWQRADDLAAKDRIYALRVDGVPKAYPLELLVQAGVVNDTIGDTEIVLVATRGRVTVEGTSLRVGEVSYDSGGEVRAFVRDGRQFATGPEPDLVLDQDGDQWSVTEAGLIGPDGETAPRLNGHLAYWFGWFAFFPNTQLYGGG